MSSSIFLHLVLEVSFSLSLELARVGLTAPLRPWGLRVSASYCCVYR